MFSRLKSSFFLVILMSVGLSAASTSAQQHLFEIPQPEMLLAQAKTDAEIAADIRASQKLLAKLGYYSGSATGKESSALTKAVKAYQKDKKLVVSGKANGTLVRSLESALKKAEVHEKRVLVVEQMLKKLDYSPGRVDGKEDSSLTKAIKAFQKDRKSQAKKKGLVNGITIRSLRTAMEAKGLTPPRDAYTLSNLDGKTSSSSKKKKKKKSTSSKKTSSSSKTTKSKSKSSKSTEKQGNCKKGQVQVGEKCLKACKSGYTRDKKSNRCKKDAEKSTSSSKKKTSDKKAKTSSKSSDDCKKGTEKVGSKCLKVCKSGYTRDKKSNRCKKDKASTSTKSSSSKTKTCKAGTEKVGSKCLKKCKTGYKRDSKTNRCKKK